VIPKKIKYFPWMSREAIKKSKALGSIKNSITSGGGNLAGYLGEIALARHLKADNISSLVGFFSVSSVIMEISPALNP